MKLALDLTFPQHLITKPVIFDMSKKFDVVFNLRRARVTESIGEIVMELEGEQDQLDQAIGWLKKQGLKVDPVTKDTLES